MIIQAILACVFVAGVVFGIKNYLYYTTHEDTDDAQIDGDLSAVVARVGGYVDTIAFEDNQRVEKGQLLVKLDEKEYRLKLEQALSSQKVAGSRIGAAMTAVTTTQVSSDVDKAETDAAKASLWQAQQDYNRYAALIKSGSVPQQQYDKAKATLDASTAVYQAAVDKHRAAIAEIDNSRSQLAVTNSELTQQQVAIDYASLLLSYTNIQAPVSGIVTKRRIQKGQLVQAGQTLFAVVDESNIYVTANFKETQMRNIHEGQEATISVDAFPDIPVKGEVYNYAGTTGAKIALLPPDNATGNFVKVVQRIPVKIKINASRELLSRIRPGMNVEVSVKTK
ncbi:MAG TPA: HlyD family secretion protein [Chitinophaga sp.]|uniref:HlyD family secretion protein n=1 Tax=Chitinophaga sp. TaxID=1869181 RepID=UPI002CF106ED|nr:HlyD family secretion protein [Chitinophaga sp.]HVI47054.1 HlyD family secretion protein [Chitinophaga sp.]